MSADLNRPSSLRWTRGTKLQTELLRRFDPLLALLIVSLGLALCFLWAGRQRTNAVFAANATLKSALDDTLPKTGDTLEPALLARDSNGQIVHFVDPTKASLWVFFSVHCHICMSELHSWSDLKEQIRSQNGAVHFLSMDTPAEVAAFSGDNRELPVSAAPKEVLRTLRLTAVPCYLLVAPDGAVLWSHRGALARGDRALLYSEVKSVSERH
jgi:hypothetical protein